MCAMSHLAPRTTEPPPRADSMLLLRNLVANSLDEGYARAAAERGDRTPRAGGGWLVAGGLLAVGLLLAAAFTQTRARAGSVAEARDALVAQVQRRTQANEAARRLLDRQRAEVQRRQREVLTLTAQGAGLARQLDRLSAATGAAPVVGPGMVVRLDDASPDTGGAGVDPRAETSTEGRVSDRDLQTVVNEVWAAGAEAVAVNGQRLTAQSAIRAAGEAVLVDFRPLSPPYVVRAIGDPARLRPAFVDGFGGSYLQALGEYGITSAVRDAERLTLPASVGVGLRYAVAVAAEAPLSVATSPTGRQRAPRGAGR